MKELDQLPQLQEIEHERKSDADKLMEVYERLNHRCDLILQRIAERKNRAN